MPITLLEGLNENQRLAVTHDQGPALIIAGAGTGKTRVVTSRILYLLNELKVKSDQILALTFTEKAAKEMEERVDLQMPLGYEEITIKTFHGFCDLVLKESGFEIGLDPSYRLVSQVDVNMLIKKNLFKFNLEYYRPLGNPSKFLMAILGFFGRLKDEDILPSEFLTYAQQNLKDVDAANKELHEDAKKLMELANFYNQVQNFVRASGYLDFSDLIFYTLRLFERRPSCLSKYQERFRYLMVDEFQDTNYAQSKLVNMLAQKHQNLFVVGDDDQAIYKWRGASLKNIMQFSSDYPTAKKIVLTENYRSSEAILNGAYSVIKNNDPHRLEVEIGIDKKLNSNIDCQEKIKVLACKHYVDEVNAVVKQIKELHAGGEEYQDFAILGRTNSSLKPYAAELQRQGIPYKLKQNTGLLRNPLIKDLIALLKFLNNPYDDVALIRLLSFEMWELEMKDILSFAYQARGQQLPIWKFFNAQEKRQQESFLDADKKLIEALRLLSDLLNYSAREAISAVINKFFLETEYYKFLVDNDGGYLAEAKALEVFSKILVEYERDQNNDAINDFLEYLYLLEDSAAIDYSPESDDNDAVSLLTVHASKGLEFNNVFVVSLVKNRFPSINKKASFEIPEQLLKEDLSEVEINHTAEERRLFYVASTRAKRRLFLSFSEKYEGSRKWKKSVFIDELSPETVEYNEIENTSEDLFKIEKQELQPQYKGELKEKRLPGKVSFSQFNSYKMCPQLYRFRYLLKLPNPMSHAANFGSSLHNTLNIFYQSVKNGKIMSLEDLHDLYLRCWIPTGYTSIAHHNARKKKGWEILDDYYQQNQPFITPAFLERGFTVKVNNVDIIGRIDRIDQLEDGTYEIIDYKTGTFKKNAKLDKDLQLSIYALAARDIFGLNVSKLSLYFLGDNLKVSTERTDEQLDQCIQKVEELINDIHQADFAPTPGFPCSYCEYSLICDDSLK